nr:membrane protein [Microbacterium flavescens]
MSGPRDVRLGAMTARSAPRPDSVLKAASRVLLATLLLVAGISHLTWGRRGYRIVVPDWATELLRTDKDAIVVASGAVELMLGGALLALPRERRRIGWIVAGFFVAVFPGNVHQWRTGRDAPLMRTDRARFIRLLLQPLLVAWALWSTWPERAPGSKVQR